MRSLDEINKSWRENYPVTRTKHISDQGEKKVSFANDGKPLKVHWSYACEQSRKGGWDYIVADRHRFKKKIHKLQSFKCLVQQRKKLKTM